MKSSATTLTAEEIARVASILKQPYESGDVIALFFPTTATINDLYVALGEQPMYVDPQEQLNSEDLYPIAKRYNGNAAHYFSYILPGSKTVLNDIIEQVISEDVSGNTPNEKTNDDEDSTSYDYADLRGAYVFQARRYAAFIRWAAHIDAEMEKQREFVSSSPQFKAAEGSSNLFDYSAQRVSFNFDYYKADVNWPYWGKHEWSYSAGVNNTIYSFHHFGKRNDYFIIQSNTFVKPTNVDVASNRTENGCNNEGRIICMAAQHFGK